jgi:hypothetical protein
MVANLTNIDMAGQALIEGALSIFIFFLFIEKKNLRLIICDENIFLIFFCCPLKMGWQSR